MVKTLKHINLSGAVRTYSWKAGSTQEAHDQIVLDVVAGWLINEEAWDLIKTVDTIEGVEPNKGFFKEAQHDKH